MISFCMQKNEDNMIVCYGDSNTYGYDPCVPVKQGAWVESEKLCWETHRLSDFYRAVSKKLGIDFADAGEWNIPLAYDGVHFTEEGHRIFSENVVKAIENLSMGKSA